MKKIKYIVEVGCAISFQRRVIKEDEPLPENYPTETIEILLKKNKIRIEKELEKKEDKPVEKPKEVEAKLFDKPTDKPVDKPVKKPGNKNK